jgi:uncharacterized protein
MANADAGIDVEVVFSPQPRVVERVLLALPAGATLQQAVQCSGLLARFAAAGPAGLSFSVWGRAQPQDHVLREGDRVEICRPLTVDPMQARRLRHQRQRASSKPARGGKAAG